MWTALLRAVGLAGAGQAAVGAAKWAFKRPVVATPLEPRRIPETKWGDSRAEKALGHLTSGRLVNAIYSVDAISRLASRLGGLVKPHFYHHVVVAVKGGPRASMTRTWQLACSLAFGQMRNGVGFASDYSIDCTWDITKKAVQITTGYELGWQAWLGAREFIRRGPISSTVGGAFPREFGPAFALQPQQNANAFFDLQDAAANGQIAGPLGDALAALRDFENFVNPQDGLVVGGRPVPAGQGNGQGQQVAQALDERRKALVNAGLAGQFDILPDDGRLILTEAKEIPDVQPYRPFDYGDLVSLVANALTDPGFLPTAPPDGPRTGDPAGTYVYTPGEKVRDSVLQGRVQDVEQPQAGAIGRVVGGVIGAFLGAAQRLGFGIDGYVRRGRGQTVPVIQGPTHEERIP